MLAPTREGNDKAPLLIMKLRSHLMNFFDNPDNFVIPTFVDKMTAALDGIEFGVTTDAAIDEKVKAAQRICVEFFDFCRPELRGLYKVPLLGFTFGHFLQIAEEASTRRSHLVCTDRFSVRKSSPKWCLSEADDCLRDIRFRCFRYNFDIVKTFPICCRTPLKTFVSQLLLLPFISLAMPLHFKRKHVWHNVCYCSLQSSKTYV